MLLVDHEGLFIDFPHHVAERVRLDLKYGLTAVAPREEEKLLHQMVHMVGLIFDHGNAFLKDLFIRLAPPVQIRSPDKNVLKERLNQD